MRNLDWLQLVLYIAALILITKPMGVYLFHVLDAKGKTWLDWLIKPFERVTYKLIGVNPDEEHDWKRYTMAMLLFSLVGMLFTRMPFCVCNILLPLNPQKFGAFDGSFFQHRGEFLTTNTNWRRATPMANQPCPLSSLARC